MFQQIKRLGTDTAIYGVSTIIGRFLNFLLVPFYTNVLMPGDYGVVTYMYSLIAFVTVIYSYGMESAFFKYSSTLEIGTPRQNFSTPFLSLFGTSILFSTILVLLTTPISHAIHLPEQYSNIMVYAAGILAFDAMAIIPFAALRMERNAKKFAAIKFLNIFINVVMNIVLLVVLKRGIEGIFISGLTASILTFVMLLPTIARHFTAAFNKDLVRALLKFGLPFIPAGLATMAVQVIDRPILRALTDDATVGIYQANYRLGIFMMLVVSMYDYAWRPFYFSIAKQPDAKEIFARVLTYLLLVMSGIFLVLTFFLKDVVSISFFGKHLIHPDYWGGLNIVPVVLLGYMFLGVSTNLSAGIYIEKKTHYLPPNTFVGAAVNVAANYFLIPSMGMMGAAWATFFAYFVMAAMLYVVVQRVYPIRYEFDRLAKIGVATGAVTGLYYFFNGGVFPTFSSASVVFFKIGLLAIFLLLMYYMRFFEGKELAILKRLVRKPGMVSPPTPESEPPLEEHGV
jgi:O-antigen/teichoic acid export membrane protein